MDEDDDDNYYKYANVSNTTASSPEMQVVDPFLPKKTPIANPFLTHILTRKVDDTALQVDIHPTYDPTTEVLPLTIENLQKLSLDSLATPPQPSRRKRLRAQQQQQKTTTTTATAPPPTRQLYKTELCETFTVKGYCKYESKCQFAHGLDELQIKERANNFRTKNCNNWLKLGYCPYGNRCCFKHGDNKDIQIYVKAGTYVSRQEQQQQQNEQASAHVRKPRPHTNPMILKRMKW